MSLTTKEIISLSPVIPVMVIETMDQALPLAKALADGGLKVLEITLRTDVALEALKAIKSAYPELAVGAGTVITPKTLQQAVDANADFLVSPGTTPALLDAAADGNIPLLPGVSSPSEVMALIDRGYECMKFFPAEAAGGIPMLKSIGGPLPQAHFCPTGGISLEKARDYLSLNNVSCVGGSWMVKPERVRAGDWQTIQAQAAEAAALSSGQSI